MELFHRHASACQSMVEHLLQELFVCLRIFSGVAIDPAGRVHNGRHNPSLLNAVKNLDAGLVDADGVGRYVLGSPNISVATSAGQTTVTLTLKGASS